MSSKFTSPLPTVRDVLVTFPAPHIMLVTLNRPRQLNSMPSWLHAQLSGLFHWYDDEQTLRCAIITGSGRAFCAGADLKEWNEHNNSQTSAANAATQPNSKRAELYSTPGFGGLSNRVGRKPVIAAVNGLCMGGGMEIAINCDMVVAAESAQFALPEVKRGVVALAGSLPRVVRTLGKQRAAEMVLTGRVFGAAELERWGVVNQVVGKGGDVVGAAVKLAEQVAENSPDSVMVSREGLRLGWEGIGPELATELVGSGLYGQMNGGENMKEGVLSFVEKRKPVYKDSKL